MRNDIARWLDLARWAPNDVTKRKLFYDGVMGSKKVVVLSAMEPMPSVPKPEGCCYGAEDNRITVQFDGKFYEVRYRVFNTHADDPPPGGKPMAMTASGTSVYQYLWHALAS